MGGSMFDLFKKKTKKEPSRPIKPGIGQVKHILAVASGKGGVGKSTVAVNLALALKNQGHQVGLIDADLYGPSQSTMMGLTDQPKSKDGAMIPLEQFGVKFISVGNLNPKGGAVVMRAPMAVKAISQFLSGVLWGELDYMIIDLPPGTGDIQLTMAQQAQLKGAIIVTTPQRLALEISAKAIDLFKNVNVPIMGVVENMSGFHCQKCGETTDIFETGGGTLLSDQQKVNFLGAIGLDPKVMAGGDKGKPVTEFEQDSPTAKNFFQIAQNLSDRLEQEQEQSQKVEPKNIQIFEDNGALKLTWKDDFTAEFNPFKLRSLCPCASCVDENTGQKILKEEDIPLGIKITGARPIGRYGLQLDFDDGHNTGIFRFNKLRELAEAGQASAEETLEL
jgi:ATP-binding protein involved in chromosome partitioning